VLAHTRGDCPGAATLLEQALEELRPRGYGPAGVGLLQRRGAVARDQGDLESAAAHYAASLALAGGTGDSQTSAGCVEGSATVAHARGEDARAVRLLAAAHSLRTARGVVPPPTERVVPIRVAAAARRALGDDAFGAAWGAGAALSLVEAIAEARCVLSSSSGTSRERWGNGRGVSWR